MITLFLLLMASSVITGIVFAACIYLIDRPEPPRPAVWMSQIDRYYSVRCRCGSVPVYQLAT